MTSITHEVTKSALEPYAQGSEYRNIFMGFIQR